MVQAIPDGYHTVMPVLVFKDARKAMEFYKTAFGAVELFAMPGPGGRGVMVAQMRIGDSVVMFGEEGPVGKKSAEMMGGSPVSFFLYVPDADAAYQQAVAAGATSTTPVADQFWGDRCGGVKDPFGYYWMLASHTRDMSMEEIAAASKAAMGGGQK